MKRERIAADFVASLAADPTSLGAALLRLAGGRAGPQAAEFAITIADTYEGGEMVLRLVEAVGWYEWGLPMPEARAAYLRLQRDTRTAVARATMAAIDAACPT